MPTFLEWQNNLILDLDEWFKHLEGLSSEDKKKLYTPLLLVTTASDYFLNYIHTYPKEFISLWKSKDLFRIYSSDCYFNILQERLKVDLSIEDWMSILRQFRHREMIRIIWRDILKIAEIEETLSDLSFLADACLLQTVKMLQVFLEKKYGVPYDKSGRAQAIQIITMGKLGGQELNLSSDIDLIFTYPEEGMTEGGEESLSNQSFFTLLAQKIILIINQVTQEGFVFRVDTRLRPFGDSGPLVIPFSSFKDYFANHARVWERYAFIKARILCGNEEDNARLSKLINEFVYQTASDRQIMKTLASIKEKICEQVATHSKQQNIKLGSGGIREIEFIVQVFKLIYGSEDMSLRQKNLINDIKLLRDELYLKPETADGLLYAYKFYRVVENRLQCFSDKQTHELPKNPLVSERIAYGLGYKNPIELLEDLDLQRDWVAKRFSKLTEKSFSEISISKAQALKNINFQKQLILKNEIKIWEENNLDYKNFDHDAWKELIKELISNLLIYPNQQEVLQRILKLLTVIVQENLTTQETLPTLLAAGLKVATMSTWLADELVSHPEVISEGIKFRRLSLPENIQKMKEALHFYLKEHASRQKDQLLLLMEFKREMIMRIALADVLDFLPVMQVSDRLSELAESILYAVSEEVWHTLCKEYGKPQLNLEHAEDKGFTIIGYGKLGGIELGYGSDLDLVFLHSGNEQAITDGEHPISSAQFYQRLGKHILEKLSVQTSLGRLYEVDTRLKPLGESGVLVASFSTFLNYQRESAWTWEHQALVRARPIVGDKKLMKDFIELRKEILTRPREIKKLQQEVIVMREKMRATRKEKEGYFHLKHDKGGITDIEFLAQYVVLAWSHLQPLLVLFTDNIRIFETCESAGLLSRKTVDELCNAYRDLRTFYHRLALQNKNGLVSDSRFLKQRAIVSRIWQFLLAE